MAQVKTDRCPGLVAEGAAAGRGAARSELFREPTRHGIPEVNEPRFFCFRPQSLRLIEASPAASVPKNSPRLTPTLRCRRIRKEVSISRKVTDFSQPVQAGRAGMHESTFRACDMSGDAPYSPREGRRRSARARGPIHLGNDMSRMARKCGSGVTARRPRIWSRAGSMQPPRLTVRP